MGPLEGLKLIEISGIGPGPYCAMLLADMGAEVVRVVRPGPKPFGQEGPLAKTAGHDINYIALAGVLAHIGRKGQPPTPPINLIGDFGGGGLLLAFGMVCALLERVRSGKG